MIRRIAVHRVRHAVVLVALAFMQAPVAGQGIAPVWGLGAGGTKSGDFLGFSLAASLDGQVGFAYGALGLDASAGPTGSDSRYYRDQFDNGGSACRDEVTGQFVNDEKCTALDAGAWAEVGGVIPLDAEHEIRIGIGGRAGKHSTLYGRFRLFFPVSPATRLSFGVAGGRRFFQGVVSWVLLVPR